LFSLILVSFDHADNIVEFFNSTSQRLNGAQDSNEHCRVLGLRELLGVISFRTFPLIPISQFPLPSGEYLSEDCIFICPNSTFLNLCNQHLKSYNQHLKFNNRHLRLYNQPRGDRGLHLRHSSAHFSDRSFTITRAWTIRLRYASACMYHMDMEVKRWLVHQQW
jgi:hypothetical protein